MLPILSEQEHKSSHVVQYGASNNTSKTKGGQPLLQFLSFDQEMDKFSGFWTQTDKILKILNSKHMV